MKKLIITALTALLMTAVLTGCGPAAKEDNNTTGSSDVEVVEEPKEIEIVPTQEILDADNESFKVQICNDFVIKLPMTLQELMDMGVTIPEDVNPINEILRPGNGKTLDVTINGVTCKLFFDVPRTDNNEKQLKDCLLDVLDSGLHTGDYCPFILPKGIRVGSTVDELKAAYGEPYEERLDYIEYNFYSQDKTLRQGISFQIDIEKQTIIGIMFDLHPENPNES